MADSHRTKKRRTDAWSPEDSTGSAKSGAKHRRSSMASKKPIDSYRSDQNRRGRHESSRDSVPPEFRRPANADSYRPRNTATTVPGRSFSKRPRNQNQHFQSNNHSTKARKSNPSTRIHSLRKQLAHSSAATLPANILAEKERELQFLIDSRDGTQNGIRNVSKRDRKEKKTLSQYHMVRFFERKKAERNLKRTRKQVEAATEQEDGSDQKSNEASSTSLEKEVRRHECDLLYCLYAPLGEKYIALFAGDGQSDKSKARKSTQKERGLPEGGLSVENPHTIRISMQAQDDTFRPAYWYTIENILHSKNTEGASGGEGDLVQTPQDNDAWTSVTISPDQQQQLEALRDGKNESGTSNSNGTATLDAGLAVRSKESLAGKKRKDPSWQEETDEPIDPMDADSDDSEDGGVALDDADDGGDAEESDGDFFE